MKKRVLHITSSLDSGGVASLLYSYCSKMSNDNYYFDFIVTSKNIGYIEKKMLEEGFNVWHVRKFRNNPFSYYNQIKKIICNGNYDVVHDHNAHKAYFSLKIAKKCGVSKRIAHAHSAVVNENLLYKAIRKIFTPLTKKVSTELFACGTFAGKWSWGKTSFFVMPNAIDISKYSYSKEMRNKYLRDLNLNNTTIIGTISRLSPEKNHRFLIDVFCEYEKINPQSVLMIIGTGPLAREINDYANKSSASEKIKFLGQRTDVSDIINIFDIFVLPSSYEGLPVTIVEAQANGVACLISDSVTKEVAFNTNVQYYSLAKGPRDWAKKIDNLACVRDNNNIISKSLFNIENAYKIVEEEYDK